MIRKVAFSAALLFLLATPSWAQQQEDRPDARPAGFEAELGTMRVHVRNGSGSPLSVPAQVRLRQRAGGLDLTETAQPSAGAIFRSLPPGDYSIEVTAPGFQTVTETAMMQSGPGVSQFFVHLTAASGSHGNAASGPPPLPPKAAKQVQEAIIALSGGNTNDAQKRLQGADKAAPGHPEVLYLFGVLQQKRSDPAGARQYFEKTVELYPQHAGALRALGRLLFQQGDLNGAAAYLERALASDGRSADSHSLLATVFLDLQQFEKARYHAEQSLEISAGRKPETRLLLAQIFMAQGDQQQALATLQKFLADHPAHQGTQIAQRMIARLEGKAEGDPGDALPGVTESPSRGGAAPGTGPTPAGSGSTPRGALGFAAAAEDSESAVGPEREWAPRDVDETPPSVFRDVACDAKVIELVGKRVLDMVRNLGDVNAVEDVLHTEIDGKGRPRRTVSRKYEYMFAIRTAPPDRLWTEEMRNGLFGGDFIGEFGTNGLVAMALIFHPHFAGDFEVRCEGQGSWQGEPVWFLHFRQREDKPARFYRYRFKQSVWVPLKGRAWVTANTHHIVRMEIGLSAPIVEEKLQRMQWVIEYKPVEFKERGQTYWLPSSAEIFVDARGKRWHRRHGMSNYVHFSVDTKYKVADPKTTEEIPPEETKKPPR